MTTLTVNSPDWTDPAVDPRLVICDLDGTLLDGNGRVPAEFWPLLTELQERGIIFTVASGRQFATLEDMFAAHREGMVFIAENGTYVVRDGEELSSSSLPRDYSEQLVRSVRALADAGNRLDVVWCSRGGAFVECSDPEFLASAARFFHSLHPVEDLLRDADEALKFSIYDADGTSESHAELIAPIAEPCRAIASTPHWIDVMPSEINKGVAVRQLQASLGVRPDQTVIFGDYLNDLEMMGEATLSFAMANAHPEVIREANYLAPTNLEGGVLTVLRQILAAG